MNIPSGHWGASPPHHPAQCVSTCCQGGVEKGREIHLLKLPAKPTQAGSWRKLVCHSAGGLFDLLERNLGLIIWGISAKEVTWPTTMWAPAERGSHSGHLVLTDEPVAKAGGVTLQEEDQYRAAAATYQPFSQSESQSWSHERRGWHGKALQETREAHKQGLEATHWLEVDIERLGQGVVNVQHQCPCSQSDSCWQSKSLDRQDRSLSRCILERHVTFHKPEVEPFLGGGHCGLWPTRCQEQDWLPIGTFNRELWGMVELAGLPARHTTLVERAGCNPRGGRPKEVGPEDLGLLLDSCN